MDQRTLQLADSVCAHFDAIVMTGSGTIFPKLTFTLDSGAAVSAAPKSLGDDYPMQIEEPRPYKTATGSLVQDEGFRVLPIVTEEGLHRSTNFRVAPVHKALVSASKVCRKRLPNHPGFRAWTKWHASQTHETNGSGCAKKKVSTFSMVWHHVTVREIQKQVRVLKSALEERMKCEVPSRHPILAFLVEHAGRLMSRSQVGRDGRTAYELHAGKPYRRQLVEFGERVYSGRGGGCSGGSCSEQSVHEEGRCAEIRIQHELPWLQISDDEHDGTCAH